MGIAREFVTQVFTKPQTSPFNQKGCFDRSDRKKERKVRNNRPFPSCFKPHYESEAKCKVFVMKISFHSYANKTNFHMKSFALSLAFIVKFMATRKWPIIK